MTMMQGLSLTGVSNSVNAKKRGEAWLSTCLSHVKSIHKLLSSLYDGLESEQFVDDDFESDVHIERGDSTKHTKIFADHCYKLINLMSQPTNGPVELPLSHILTAITRCLKLSYADVLSVPSRTDLASLLPCLHQSCMDVLSQLILCCGGDILFQSHVVIDLCLQTIASTGKMEADAKCRTRSSAYQALVLWIRTCGWGKYLSSHSKALIHELMTDTQADAEDGLAKKAHEGDIQPKQDVFIRRKKKDKKKKRKGDSYMDLEGKEDGNEKERCNEERIDLVVWAFSLSQLTVENLPYSTAQNLVSHIIKTASTVQRLSLNRPEPYRQGEARKGLYQAVASCLLSTLDYGCNRNDAVGHYQLTNSALDLLSRAVEGEETQVQTVCSQALDVLRSSANLKGPVIRKVLDYDDSTVEDVSQLMREKDQMTDRIEDLRQKLTNSEVENEQQSRLISSLREQISSLQSKVTAGSFAPSTNDNTSRSSQQDDNQSDDEDEDEDGKDSPMPSDHYKNNGNREITPTSDSDHKNAAGQGSVTTEDGEASTSKTAPTRGDSTAAAATVSTSKAKARGMQENKRGTKQHSKRTNLSDESPAKDVKRSKMDLSTDKEQSATTSSNVVEDMLLDFVDAPPDS